MYKYKADKLRGWTNPPKDTENTVGQGYRSDEKGLYLREWQWIPLLAISLKDRTSSCSRELKNVALSNE